MMLGWVSSDRTVASLSMVTLDPYFCTNAPQVELVVHDFQDTVLEQRSVRTAINRTKSTLRDLSAKEVCRCQGLRAVER